jgi:hypothetical protein
MNANNILKLSLILFFLTFSSSTYAFTFRGHELKWGLSSKKVMEIEAKSTDTIFDTIDSDLLSYIWVDENKKQLGLVVYEFKNGGLSSVWLMKEIPHRIDINEVYYNMKSSFSKKYGQPIEKQVPNGPPLCYFLFEDAKFGLTLKTLGGTKYVSIFYYPH